MIGRFHCSIAHPPSKLPIFSPILSQRRPSPTWDICLGWVKDGNLLLFIAGPAPCPFLREGFVPCGFPSFPHFIWISKISDLCIEATWDFVAKASFVLWAILIFWLRGGVGIVIHHLVPYSKSLVNFICICALIHHGLDLGSLIGKSNQLNWSFHTYMSSPG